MQFFAKTGNGLEFKRRGETVRITPWGEGLRVQATKNSRFAPEDWALLPCETEGTVCITETGAAVENGKIRMHAPVSEFFRDSSLCREMNILPPALIRMKDMLRENGFTVGDEITDVAGLAKELARQVKRHG